MSTEFQTKSYLTYHFQDSPELVSVVDELPLWSAPFGLLLLKHVALKRNMSVIDIGCGTGFPLLELAERLGNSCRFYGVDIWKHALDRTREKLAIYNLSNVSLIESSAEDMPFEDATIDLIVSNLGVNNFESPEAVLKECHRMLWNGGKLVLTTNLNGHWQCFYDIFEATLHSLGEEELAAKIAPHTEHRGTVSSILALLGQSGFRPSRHFEEQFEMTFLDGDAFLNHHFVKLGWLDSWRAMIPPHKRERVFTMLEEALNQNAEEKGVLKLTVPMAFIEVEKAAP